MTALLTLLSFVVLLAVATLSLRRAWLSRTPNWLLYVAYSGVSANLAMAISLQHARIPAGTEVLMAATGVLGWWLLRQYSRYRRAAALRNEDNGAY